MPLKKGIKKFNSAETYLYVVCLQKFGRYWSSKAFFGQDHHPDWGPAKVTSYVG